jgi:hypothetical protein
MSERNSSSRTFAARVDRLRGSFGGMAASAIIALTALGVGCQIAETTAAATYAAALTLGGFLLARAVAVKRGSNEPSKSWVELQRVRVRPCDIVDRNHR